MTCNLQVVLSREISASKLSEVFNRGNIVSARRLQNLQETAQPFEFSINRYSSAPSLSSVNPDEMNAFEPRYSTALVSVSTILRGSRNPQIGKGIIEGFFGNFMVHLNRWIGDSKDKSVHEEAGLEAMLPSPFLRFIFWVRNCANGVVLILSANLHRVPVPSHEPLIEPRIDDGDLSPRKRYVPNRGVCGLFNGRSFASTVPALFATSGFQCAAMRAWVVVFGMFDKLVGRLNSLMFTHGVAPYSTPNGICGNSAASPLLYQQGAY
jgi:hypothetical protein